ncbi:MAG TPA: tripartite tricarboxylate transporter substrate binding protein [Casimicrobiaceae bacterium]|nr:tripartite tricarboxylate transporter substrate binding protein [Casimicrobiaceae bacterium]
MRFAVGLRQATGAIVATVVALVACVAFAQEKYPSRPIEFIVPWGPGGGADQVARKSGKMMEDDLKVSFPVVNVPGATGNTGMAKLLAGQPDGYSISVMTWDTYALLATTPSTKWSLKDIIPVALMIKQPSAFMTASNGNLKTWADVEREAKTRTLKVAVTGFGSPDDITVNYFVARGLKLIAVPFANPGERYTAVLGGHADLLYEQLGDVRSFLDSKQIHPVIIFAEKRFSAFPDVPASKELGFDITLPQRRAVIMKAGTDPAKVKVVSDALAKVAASAEYKAYLKEQYATDDSYFAAADAQRIMEEDLAQMKRFAAQTPAKK